MAKRQSATTSTSEGATPRKVAPPALEKGKSKAITSTVKSKSKSTPKLYSSFNAIPITLPSPSSLASSSKGKSSSATTHYIYVRPHKGTDRTVFVTNLPVDIGERELRAVFGTWGVVEDISIGREAVRDTLEKAVEDEESGSESEQEEEDDEQQQEEEEEEGRHGNPVFVPNEAVVLTKSQRQNRRRRKGVLPPSVPEVIPLPPTNPRTANAGAELSPSGSHMAHITFLDAISVSKVMLHRSTSAIPLSSMAGPTGLEYYTQLHSALRPPTASIKQFADSSMDRYDHLHSLLLSSRARQKGAGALVDEDGFTVVVRGGRYGRTGGRGDLGSGSVGVGVAKRGLVAKEATGGAAALSDFYKFQKVDRKRKGQYILVVVFSFSAKVQFC